MERAGWESFRGNPRRFEIGRGYLKMVSSDDSVSIQTERGFPLDPRQQSRLEMKFQVKAIPRGTNLTKKSGDDSAFRLYVAFDRGGFIGLLPPNTIGYSWTEASAPGQVVQSEHFERLRYLSVGHGLPAAGPAGTTSEGWISVTRDLAADYRRVFPEDTDGVPEVLGIVLKCDSNNTHTTAESWVSEISIR